MPGLVHHWSRLLNLPTILAVTVVLVSSPAQDPGQALAQVGQLLQTLQTLLQILKSLLQNSSVTLVLQTERYSDGQLVIHVLREVQHGWQVPPSGPHGQQSLQVAGHSAQLDSTRTKQSVPRLVELLLSPGLVLDR